MHVALTGNIPGATTAGIMLLTRARQLGFPLTVEVVGDPQKAPNIPGPAVVYAPVLASCGVGREHGFGATVVIPGPPGHPVMVTAQPHGVGGWFLADRTGEGTHPATRAFIRLSRDPRLPARHLGKDLRRAMKVLGMSSDPAVLDVLFGAPVPPLLRLALALRAGRAISGGRGEPVTRYLAASMTTRDPIGPSFDRARTLADLRAGAYQWIVDRLSTSVHDRVEEWLNIALQLAEEDDGRDLELVHALAELGSHLVQLPQHSILPPLGAAEDSAAVGLKEALTAEGDGDACQQLCQMFRFLGGHYVDEVPEHALDVCDDPAPDDVVSRWQWFSTQVRAGRKRADALWTSIFDPPQ